LGYRCVFRNEYPGDEDHPKSLFVAESRILPALDEWLRTLSSKNLEETMAEMIEHAAADEEQPPEIRRARIIAGEAQTKLDRYMDAIEKGMDPTLYVERSRTAQRELVAARAVIERHSSAQKTPLGEAQLRGLLERLGDIVELLRHAEPDERRVFYQELGLRLAYQRLGEREKIRAYLGVEFSRVGGGT
jgi:site-specific DNA recombinase